VRSLLAAAAPRQISWVALISAGGVKPDSLNIATQVSLSV